jgi:superfamily II DNA helicase RecQ
VRTKCASFLLSYYHTPVPDISTPQAQSSMVKGLPAIAINEDSLREAASETPPRHLLKDALEWKWGLIIVSPEMLITPGFNQVLSDSSFQKHLSLLFIDECHLVDEQGSDFRPCYKLIGLLRSRIPTHIPWIAVSATLPPGKCFDAVTESLGFHANHYIHHALPIDNQQICYIPRILQYPVSGTSFLDLAWLIPPSTVSPDNITKTLIFCETIELGSRVYNFLWRLLPQPLHRNREIILPYHSLLSKSGRTTVMQNFRLGTTRIVIGTNCFTWGVDVPDIRNVVVFGLPSSFSKLVQQIGRAGRDGDQAYAITYAAQWVKDIPEGSQKGSKQEIANLKQREAMCPVLRSWFNASPTSCPRTVLCNHFGEHASHPKKCCIYHHKVLPSMDPTESRVEQFSPLHTKAPTVRSDGLYESFRDRRFVAL